jgi:chaperone BCS1
MIEFLQHAFNGHNQFASGGLLLMLIGAVGAYLRAIPARIWECVVDQTTMMITVKDDDAAFVWVKEWFLDQEFLKRIRRVDLDTTLRGERVAMIPAQGLHWFWYAGRPFQVWFTRSEGKRERVERRTESLTFRTFGRRRTFLRSFVDDVVRCHAKRHRVQSRLYTYNDGWDYMEGYAPRLLDSVVLPAGEKEHLEQDVQSFRSSKQRYERLGVPYHRGYLLYGPPGTGKTSLVSALAAHFGLSIYCLNLADLTDRSLTAAVNDVPANSVLLFEDIDCMRGGKAREPAGSATAEDKKSRERTADKGGVTLSGLLNVLDGFFAPTGVLFMMTTNRMEALDSALLRPGRIDYRLYLGKASRQQKMELYHRFFPETSEVEACKAVDRCGLAETMAQFQGLLLEMSEDPTGRQVARGMASQGVLEEEVESVSVSV